MPSYVERYTEIAMKVILLMVNIDSLQINVFRFVHF